MAKFKFPDKYVGICWVELGKCPNCQTILSSSNPHFFQCPRQCPTCKAMLDNKWAFIPDKKMAQELKLPETENWVDYWNDGREEKP